MVSWFVRFLLYFLVVKDRQTHSVGLRYTTEPLKRLLKRHGNRNTTKPLRTLEQHFRHQRTDHFPRNRPSLYTRLIAQTVVGVI